MKFSHEKHNILHDLHRAESELLSARGEAQRLREEVQSLRDKMKTFHSAKIAADKKTAEHLAINSRLEVGR